MGLREPRGRARRSRDARTTLLPVAGSSHTETAHPTLATTSAALHRSPQQSGHAPAPRSATATAHERDGRRAQRQCGGAGVGGPGGFYGPGRAGGGESGGRAGEGLNHAQGAGGGPGAKQGEGQGGGGGGGEAAPEGG